MLTGPSRSKDRASAPHLYFSQLDPKNLPKKAVLVLRVSSQWLGRRYVLETQENNLRQALPGVEIILVVSESMSALNPRWHRILAEAAELAKMEGAVLVTEATDRIIRSKDFHAILRPRKQPSRKEYAKLRKAIGNVPVFTLCHPHMTQRELRKVRSERGRRVKGKLGGRPLKGRDAFRRRFLPVAVLLRNEGKTVRAIADYITKIGGKYISPMSISRWLRRPDVTKCGL